MASPSTVGVDAIYITIRKVIVYVSLFTSIGEVTTY